MVFGCGTVLILVSPVDPALLRGGRLPLFSEPISVFRVISLISNSPFVGQLQYIPHFYPVHLYLPVSLQPSTLIYNTQPASCFTSSRPRMLKGPAEIAHGPMLIGFIFNVLLYGIMITQVYIYFVTYKMWFLPF